MGHRYPSGWEGEVLDELGAAWVAADHAVEAPGHGKNPAPDARQGHKTGKRTASRRAPRTAASDE
ncbi:hypothetical protein ACGFYE_18760 [Streptomyces zaomyceticus]|uniref:hypothetical protein n=1 Tax=Streptomyces zaomyceticus TaxID=68286 RepID=UPI003714A767